MTRLHAGMAGAALLGTIAVSGCGAARAGGAHPPSPAPVGDLAAIARARADSARYPYTAADVHFMSGMIGHHAQAVAMASWAPTHGASPAVRTLAERIVNGQQDEIVTMQQWLRDRGQRVPEARASGTMLMTMNGVEHEMQMPGTLSEAQLQRLDQARGTEFDRLFLTFMIQHHRGAVAMVEELFGTNGAGQDETVFKLASDVNVDQITELARMEKMLSNLMTEGIAR
ncbi:MAG: DUF305 domain-containing protein [Gemmatimonadetes bacterium]|nr:DUF305 domain-containing protein [Gemmatimonadota bacterium]